MSYEFKRDEFIWMVVVAAGIAVLQVFVQFDPATVVDWRTWAVALGGSAIRAGAGAAIAYLTRPKSGEHAP